MAVIYCPDCKREMSDTASVCPGCGYPYAQKKELYQKAVRLMQNCTTSDGYLGVAELFYSIQEFQDAAALEKTCRINAGACYQQEMEKARQEAEEKARQEEEARRKQEEQLERERIKKEQKEKERVERQEAFFQKYKLPIALVIGIFITGSIIVHFLPGGQVATDNDTVSAGIATTVVVQDDNTVAVISNGLGKSIESQENVIAISSGNTALEKTLLLKDDGTVSGYDWDNIVSVSVGGWHSVGLKNDGTVVTSGNNRYGQCNTDLWTNIEMIAAGDRHTVGLKKDGTVVAVGDNRFGQCDISKWTDIISVAAGSGYTVGLKSDGTVVATGMNGFNQCAVSEWTNIAEISAGASHTVAIKKDGTVVATGNNKFGQCNIDEWKNIIAISAGLKHTVALKSDGTLLAVGDNTYNQCDVDNINNVLSP